MGNSFLQTSRVPGTCCPEPECDRHNCLGCEYLGKCQNDPQRVDYCPRPRTCRNCDANCLVCSLWDGPIIWTNFSKMTEGQALWSLGIRATEKDGKKGILLPGPTKDTKPIFIQASDEKPGCIVASSEKKDRVSGARKTKCVDCKRNVWISPSTIMLLHKWPGTPVICIRCTMKRMEKEGNK